MSKNLIAEIILPIGYKIILNKVNIILYVINFNNKTKINSQNLTNNGFIIMLV